MLPTMALAHLSWVCDDVVYPCALRPRWRTPRRAPARASHAVGERGAAAGRQMSAVCHGHGRRTRIAPDDEVAGDVQIRCRILDPQKSGAEEKMLRIQRSPVSSVERCTPEMHILRRPGRSRPDDGHLGSTSDRRAGGLCSAAADPYLASIDEDVIGRRGGASWLTSCRQ